MAIKRFCIDKYSGAVNDLDSDFVGVWENLGKLNREKYDSVRTRDADTPLECSENPIGTR